MWDACFSGIKIPTGGAGVIRSREASLVHVLLRMLLMLVLMLLMLLLVLVLLLQAACRAEQLQECVAQTG